ncbi:hypothetical protein CXG81DRAFT_28223 [Caulochytrium protostelioides]|nr:hypothetical protein CXG81DRAFT_28223 [Caulochytrium protostelioides]|eukprot:RKO98998.1 hypothetical protein CXG81DRAFT_28223 [Caulochytrium protostelioides]
MTVKAKKVLKPTDSRLKANQEKAAKKAEKADNELVRHVPRVASSMFYSLNEAIVPPYQIIVDTNFINFAIRNRLEPVQAMMDCLLAKCIPCVTDCVIGELERLGVRFRLALKIARDPRFERLPCTHKGIYADDCIVSRVMQHRCYIVASCDKELKNRVRKIPGVPIMTIQSHKFQIERLPTAPLLTGGSKSGGKLGM